MITGEGFVDEGSFDGKVVGGVIEWAAEARRAGRWSSPVRCSTPTSCELARAVTSSTSSISSRCSGRDAAMTETAAVIEIAVTDWLARRTIQS